MELDNNEYQNCLEVARSFETSGELNEKLIQLAKNTWRRNDGTWVDRVWVSDADLYSLLECGMTGDSFTLNAVKKKNHPNTTSRGLSAKVIPDMLNIGMMTRDETGRYNQHLVEKIGIEFLLYTLLKCKDCELTGICNVCNGGGRCGGNNVCEKCQSAAEESEECWNHGKCRRCEETGVCRSCNEMFHAIGGLERLQRIMDYIYV